MNKAFRDAYLIVIPPITRHVFLCSWFYGDYLCRRQPVQFMLYCFFIECLYLEGRVMIHGQMTIKR